MKCSAKHFSLHKAGNHPSDYEDAYASRLKEGALVHCTEVAVSLADGAGEGTFSGEWAKLLATRFVKSPGTATRTLMSLVRKASVAWHSDVFARDLKWYALEKARKGAFSTFLGLYIHKLNKSGRWRAMALGDSCLFQVRDGELISWFPVQSSEDFVHPPALVSTDSLYNGQNGIFKQTVPKKGGWRSGDTFILATDALSAWFVSQHEVGNYPFEVILNQAEMEPREGKEAFGGYVQVLRDGMEMRNDDVTCAIITVFD